MLNGINYIRLGKRRIALIIRKKEQKFKQNSFAKPTISTLNFNGVHFNGINARREAFMMRRWHKRHLQTVVRLGQFCTDRVALLLWSSSRQWE